LKRYELYSGIVVMSHYATTLCRAKLFFRFH